MGLPDEGVWHHVEREAGVGEKGSCPSIVRSVKSCSNLVKVVASSLSPLPVVVLEDVVAPFKLGWVSLSLGLWTIKDGD